MAAVYQVCRRGQADWMMNLHHTVVSDCFSCNLSKTHAKALCNQHIMRELKGLEKIDPHAEAIGLSLKKLYIANKEKQADNIIQNLKQEYLQKIELGLQHYAKLPHYIANSIEILPFFCYS